MRKIISRQVLIVALFLGAFGQRAPAAEHKEWVKLTDCRYVDGPENGHCSSCATCFGAA